METRRLYYDDSYQREFSAQVLSCEPEAHGATPAWRVVLDCTALYPTSGGQPHDLGKLGDANVLDVRDEGEDADLQPCGGTHVKSTAQIGIILVRRCTKMRQDWRVEFVCGRRAARVARHDFLLLHRAAEGLGCAPEDVPASVQRAITDRDLHYKNVRVLLQRVAEADAATALQSAKLDGNGVRVVARVFSEETQAEYLSDLATQLAKAENTVALLARSACGHLIFAQHPSAGKDMNVLLKRVLEQFAGKGGGTRDFARGKLSDAAQAEKAVALAERLVSAG